MRHGEAAGNASRILQRADMQCARHNRGYALSAFLSAFLCADSRDMLGYM